jgi:hypothetical protein
MVKIERGGYEMKSWIKILSGLLVALVVIGAVTMLAIRYFDVLARGYETVKGKVVRQKERFFGGDCCDYCDDDDLEEIEDL